MLDKRKREILIKAEHFRETCRSNKYGIADLFGECERNGYKLIRYPLENDNTLGFSTKRDNDIIIFTNSNTRLSREIFTLAHEIGHILLHFNNHDNFTETKMTLSGGTQDEKEQEANYFAACLLMPKSQVEKFFELEIKNQTHITATDIAKIVSEFKVSFEMALNRLESLKKIDYSQRLRIDNQKNEQKVGNLLKIIRGDILLNENSRVIKIPMEYLDYAIYNYNHNAIPLETLEKVLSYLRISKEEIEDKLEVHTEEKDDLTLEELIGGLEE